MLKEDLFSIGQAAKRMKVSVRTLQYYDKKGLLSPSSISEGGRRLYSSKDMVRLHQIISMKALGFSLDEIKNMLYNLDSPKEVAEILENQGILVEAQIKELQTALILINNLRHEVIQMDTVDFAKYAKIVELLKTDSSFYWVIKLLDNQILDHIGEEFESKPQEAWDILSEYQEVLNQALEFKRGNESSKSENSMRLAKKWWDMVMKFTGGDMSLIPKLLDFNNNKNGWNKEMAEKQKEVDAYIGEALGQYFIKNNISIPEMGAV